MKYRPFPLLALVVSLVCFRPLVAEDSATKPEEVSQAEDTAPRVIDVRWEAYSLPQKEAHTLLRKFSTDAERYAEILRRTDAGEANLEVLQLIRTRSGQRAKVEGVDEKIYATVYEPPSVQRTDSSTLDNPATPTAFETRNVGVTLEVEPTLGPDDRTVDVTMVGEVVKYLGDDKIDHVHVSLAQPRFQSQKATWAFTIKSGQTMLVGTLSPPAGTGIPDSATEKVVWFSFVTADVAPVE